MQQFELGDIVQGAYYHGLLEVVGVTNLNRYCVRPLRGGYGITVHEDQIELAPIQAEYACDPNDPDERALAFEAVPGDKIAVTVVCRNCHRPIKFNISKLEYEHV